MAKKGHTGFRNGDLFCFNCGTSYNMQLPQPVDMAAAIMKADLFADDPPYRSSLDIDKAVDGLKEIEKLSRYDHNHDNMLYNIQEINKLAKELLNQKEGK